MDDWQERTRSEDLNPWMLSKLKESQYQARQEDDQRNSVVQHIVQKSTDFLRLIVAPVDEMGGVTLSYVCPHCHCFSLKTKN